MIGWILKLDLGEMSDENIVGSDWMCHGSTVTGISRDGRANFTAYYHHSHKDDGNVT